MKQLVAATLLVLALDITLKVPRANAPMRRVYVERSVWTGYTGLYKLQQVSEDCSRLNACPGPKAALTVAAPLHLIKSTTTRNKGF